LFPEVTRTALEKRIITQAIVKDQYFAKTLDDALDHLVAQA